MTIEIRVPTLGESVTEATVSRWLKSVGDPVKRDEAVVELETDKISLEVTAAEAGLLSDQVAKEGDTVEVGALLGRIEPGAAGAKAAPKPAAKAEVPKPVAPAPVASNSNERQAGPAARKMLEESGRPASSIAGTGKDGRVTKGDVLAAQASSVPRSPLPATGNAQRATGNKPMEERVRMSKLRQVIARRLKESQNTAAILTTFNEIDMSNLMALRSEYKDAFEKKHGLRLGFMGFFVKAAVQALKEIPAVNASIEGDEIVYKNYYDIGVAVGTEQGLVVPVIRGCDQLSLAEIEKEIGRLAGKAREGTLAITDLEGGTITISNGGVYGSLMATPIINPPQSGILGMHKIEERPIAKDGQVVVRPMMYVALSYDHRIIDGKESVTFLVRVKEAVEDPRRLLIGL